MIIIYINIPQQVKNKYSNAQYNIDILIYT